MSVQIEKYADEPFIVAVYSDPFDGSDVGQVMSAVTEHYSADGEFIYSISDASQLTLSFSDLMVALAGATRNTGWNVGAPNSATIFVGSNDMVKFGREALKQSQYGSADVFLYETLDEALAFCRQHRADQATS